MFANPLSWTDILHYFSLLSSADAFHWATDSEKRGHFNAVFDLLCIAHVLPLVCESKIIMERIWIRGRSNFHRNWTLDGWNDGIIQPARDAVLNYYKVRAGISPTRLKPIQPNFIYSLNQRYAKPSDLREYMSLNRLS